LPRIKPIEESLIDKRIRNHFTEMMEEWYLGIRDEAERLARVIQNENPHLDWRRVADKATDAALAKAKIEHRVTPELEAGD
jgi:hypothetical protein